MDLKDATLYDLKKTRRDLFDLLVKDAITHNLAVGKKDIIDLVNSVVNNLSVKLQPIVDNGLPRDIKLIRDLDVEIRLLITEQISDGMMDLQMYVLKKLNIALARTKNYNVLDDFETSSKQTTEQAQRPELKSIDDFMYKYPDLYEQLYHELYEEFLDLQSDSDIDVQEDNNYDSSEQKLPPKEELPPNANNDEEYEDDDEEEVKVGYILRLLPSQETGQVIEIKRAKNGLRIIVLKMRKGDVREVYDNNNLYIILNRSSVISDIDLSRQVKRKKSRNNDLSINASSADQISIMNVGRICRLVNDQHETIYSSTGKIICVNNTFLRVIYTWSSISITIIEKQFNGKFFAGKRILLAKYRSDLFKELDRNSYLNQIEDFRQSSSKPKKYEIKVTNTWYDNEGKKINADITHSNRKKENAKPKMNTFSYPQSVSPNLSGRKHALIGDWIIWKPTETKGEVINYKSRGSLRKLVIRLKDGTIQEVYDNIKVYDIIIE